MNRALVLSLLAAVTVALTGCAYELPDLIDDEYVFWDDATDVTMRGDVGHFQRIDSGGPMAAASYDGVLEFSGDVPVDGGTVFLDIAITNFAAMPIGSELHFGTPNHGYDEPYVDIYACPNGEGASGEASDVVVTRGDDGLLHIGAVGDAPEQNLDVTIELPQPKPLRAASLEARAPLE